jgi:hypothetical protein
MDQALAALRDGDVADVGKLLKPGGLRELEAALGRLRAGGQRARVVLTPLGEDLQPWHVLFERLGLDRQRDLLLLFNGRRWEARGWGLSPAAGQRALAAAEPALRRYYARGLVVALEGLAAAARGEPAPAPRAPGSRAPATPAPRARSSSGGWVLGVGGVAALVGLGFVIRRRRRRAAESSRSLAEARSSAEQVFAEVVLATEEMSEADGAALREKATRLKGEIDALAPPGQKLLEAKQESMTMARLQQLENELEALRSVVLQRKRALPARAGQPTRRD